MKKVIAASLVVLLAGCVTNTLSELKSEKGSFDGKIESDSSYLEVYRNLHNISKVCLEHAPLGTPVTSEGEIDKDIKVGQIRQRMVAQSVMLTTTVIDIKEVGNGKTEITLYTIKGWRAVGINIPKLSDVTRWAAGDQQCWIGNK